jgi:hypothetical protein
MPTWQYWIYAKRISVSGGDCTRNISHVNCEIFVIAIDDCKHEKQTFFRSYKATIWSKVLLRTLLHPLRAWLVGVGCVCGLGPTARLRPPAAVRVFVIVGPSCSPARTLLKAVKRVTPGERKNWSFPYGPAPLDSFRCPRLGSSHLSWLFSHPPPSSSPSPWQRPGRWLVTPLTVHGHSPAWPQRRRGTHSPGMATTAARDVPADHIEDGDARRPRRPWRALAGEEGESWMSMGRRARMRMKTIVLFSPTLAKPCATGGRRALLPCRSCSPTAVGAPTRPSEC